MKAKVQVLADRTGEVVGPREIELFLEPGRQTVKANSRDIGRGDVPSSHLLWGHDLQSVLVIMYKFTLIKGYSVSLAIAAICALASTCFDESTYSGSAVFHRHQICRTAHREDGIPF